MLGRRVQDSDAPFAHGGALASHSRGPTMSMCIHCGQDDCDAGYLCPKAPRGLDQTPESPQYDKTQLEVGHLDSTFISANVEIRRPRIVRIGRHTNVASGVYCTTAMRLGDYVHLAAY